MAIIITKNFIVAEDKDGKEWGVEKETFLFGWLRRQPGGIKVLRDMPVKIEISEVKLRKLVERAYDEGRDEVVINLQSPQGGCLSLHETKTGDTEKKGM